MSSMTPITISTRAYDRILTLLIEQHGQKALLMGYKKRVLGWTPRIEGAYSRKPLVHIDFWDEYAKSLFLLEYSEYVKL